MPNIAPPKRAVKGKGAPPPEEKPSFNLTKNPSDKPVALNFLVENQFRREFKSFAVDHDMTMVTLLRRCFEAYKAALIK